MGQGLLGGVSSEQEAKTQLAGSAHSVKEHGEYVPRWPHSGGGVSREDRKETLKKRFKAKVRHKNIHEGLIEQAELVIDMIRHWSEPVADGGRKVDLDVYLEDQLMQQVVTYTKNSQTLDAEIEEVLSELKKL